MITLANNKFVMMLLPPDVQESVGDGVVVAANSGSDGADVGQFVKCHERCRRQRGALRAGASAGRCFCGRREEIQMGHFNYG